MSPSEPSTTAAARYVTPTTGVRDLGLYLLGVGHQSGRPAPVRRRTLDCYAAVLISHGSGLLGWRGGGTSPTETELVGPVLFWLFPGVEHHYRPDGGGWSEQWVLFDGLAARTYERMGVFDRDRPVSVGAPPGPLLAVVAEGLTDRPRPSLRTVGLLHAMITATADEPGRSDVLGALAELACTPGSITEHAARLGLGVDELRQQVRRAGAGTPKELVLQTRLTRAQNLLATTDLGVAQIARSVGYDDPAYFSRLFTKRIGRSPSLFRSDQRRPSA